MVTIPRLVCVVAARPNLMKMAPILRAFQHARYPLEIQLVHTGQHYDDDMDGAFFQALAMRKPDFQLQVGSASAAQQTAQIMQRFEPVLESCQPAGVLVVGDVTSTLACALVAAQMRIPVLHVEAGLRCGDRHMPEEINRLLTDQLAELLFTTEASGTSNLLREGIAAQRIHFVGNVMIDSLQQQIPLAPAIAHVLESLSCGHVLQPDQPFALLTLHRPSNVDDPRRLRTLIETMLTLSSDVPIIFAVHPRTRARLQHFGLTALLDSPRLLCVGPQPYPAMLTLMRSAAVVMTDSGGVQEETTALGVPCLTLRDSTERPITVSEGSNALAGRDPAVILALARDILRYGGKSGRVPRYWDGHAAERIVCCIEQWLRHGREVL